MPTPFRRALAFTLAYEGGKVNKTIVRSAVDAANGKVLGLPQQPGWCLMTVRLIVEHAFSWPNGGFYDRYLVAGTSTRGGTPRERLQEAMKDKWAADIEASMKKLGFAVPALLRQPGDLVFNYRAAAPIGHVGILLTRDIVLENIRPSYRPQSIILSHGSLALTPYSSQPWTLTARLR